MCVREREREGEGERGGEREGGREGVRERGRSSSAGLTRHCKGRARVVLAIHYALGSQRQKQNLTSIGLC